MNVAPENSGLLNLHSILGADLARELATHDHGSGLYIGLNPGALSDNQRIWGKDFSPKGAADAHSPQKAQFAFELAPGLDDPRNRG